MTGDLALALAIESTQNPILETKCQERPCDRNSQGQNMHRDSARFTARLWVRRGKKGRMCRAPLPTLPFPGRLPKVGSDSVYGSGLSACGMEKVMCNRLGVMEGKCKETGSRSSATKALVTILVRLHCFRAVAPRCPASVTSLASSGPPTTRRNQVSIDNPFRKSTPSQKQKEDVGGGEWAADVRGPCW